MAGQNQEFGQRDFRPDCIGRNFKYSLIVDPLTGT